MRIYIKIFFITALTLLFACGSHQSIDDLENLNIYDTGFYNEIDMRVWADMAHENAQVVTCPEDPLAPDCPSICYKLYVEKMEVGSELIGFRYEDIYNMQIPFGGLRGPSDWTVNAADSEILNPPVKLLSRIEGMDISEQDNCETESCPTITPVETEKKYPEVMVKLSENQWKYFDGEGNEYSLDLAGSTELFTGYYYGSEKGNINQYCDGFMSKAVKFDNYVFFFQARNCLKFCKEYLAECN